MNKNTLKNYTELICKTVAEGPDLYICDLTTDHADIYPDISEVYLNFVFVRMRCGWLFFHNATNLLVGSPVRLYCTSTVTVQYPLPPKLKQVLRHFSVL